MIRKSRNQETQPDFDEMMNEVEEDIQEQDAGQDIISRVPELKQLSGDIDTATNTCANARLGLESAIQQYQRAENKLDNAITTISGKVDTINTHIDKAIEDAPTKLKVVCPCKRCRLAEDTRPVCPATPMGDHQDTGAYQRSQQYACRRTQESP